MNAEKKTEEEIVNPLPPDLLHKINAYWRAARKFVTGNGNQPSRIQFELIPSLSTPEKECCSTIECLLRMETT
jgi:hypothetical protein